MRREFYFIKICFSTRYYPVKVRAKGIFSIFKRNSRRFKGKKQRIPTLIIQSS